MTNQEIEHAFTYHPPGPGQPELYQKIREKYKELALLLQDSVPQGGELSVAFTHLQTSCFWANAGVARNGSRGSEPARSPGDPV